MCEVGTRTGARTAGRARGAIPGAALALTLLALGSPSTAGALGTNLATHVPNVNFDCRTRPSVIGPQFFGFPSTCTYLSTAQGAQSTGTPFPGGVITAVRVRAGAPTGPMRVTVLRAISSGTAGFACCFYQGESGTFTPRANGITTVGVRLPVANIFSVNPAFQAVDYLALTVLANNVAIPGQWPGNNGLEGSLAFFPRVTPQDAVSGRVDGYGNGVIPLLDANFVPLCRGRAGARPARVPRAASVPAPAESSGRRGGRCLGGVTPGRGGELSRGSAQLRLACNLTARCRGKLALRRKGTLLGRKGFKLRSGQRKRVKVKLNDAGRRAASGKRKLKVKAKATVKGAPNASRKVTLRR
jgi:hypothetical protein